jgi:hypothetical protein
MKNNFLLKTIDSVLKVTFKNSAKSFDFILFKKIESQFNFKKILYACGITLFFLYSSLTSARSESPFIYQAQVLDKNGVPCFTVGGEQKEKQEFVDIKVSEMSLGSDYGGGKLWEAHDSVLTTPITPPIILNPSTCVLYGTKFDSEHKSPPAKKLERGKIYDVEFSAGNRGSIYNRDFTAKFCLISTENGGTKAHQIVSENGEWLWDICKPLNPTPRPTYHAKIIDNNGVPCFTIKNNEKRKPIFRAIYVENTPNGISEKGDTSLLWEIHAPLIGPRENIILGPSTCLPYGINIEYAKTPTLKPLETGEIYKVEVSDDTRWSENRAYIGYFCLSSTKNGKTKVHEVPYNEKKKEWNFEVCDRLSEEKHEK